jgi:hypothetical protein
VTPQDAHWADVHAVASYQASRLRRPGLDPQDAYQQAVLLALEAKANWDPGRGRLRPYMAIAVYRGLRRWLASQPLVRGAGELVELADEPASPTLLELSSFLGWTAQVAERHPAGLLDVLMGSRTLASVLPGSAGTRAKARLVADLADRALAHMA